MGIGLDQYSCSFCGELGCLNAEKRKSLRRGAKNLFCNRSCATSYKNKIANPMNKKRTREKLSKTCKSQNKWNKNDNPNTGGFCVKNLWAQGAYDKRNLSGDNNPAWIDGRSFEKYGRGRDWNIQRRKTLKRDHYVCQKCQGPGNVVHHVIPYFISKNSNLENLQTLCDICHGKIHMKFGWKNWIGEQKCPQLG